MSNHAGKYSVPLFLAGASLIGCASVPTGALVLNGPHYEEQWISPLPRAFMSCPLWLGCIKP